MSARLLPPAFYSDTTSRSWNYDFPLPACPHYILGVALKISYVARYVPSCNFLQVVERPSRVLPVVCINCKMENGPKLMDIPYQTAIENFKAQIRFCEREKNVFTNCNAQDSITFYDEKLQEFKWQLLLLEQHYEQTSKVLPLKKSDIPVPVRAGNPRLADDELELDISDVFFHPSTESKKTYFLRYVICLPCQRCVLQEQKTELFKTSQVEKVVNARQFVYPREDPKVRESLQRGYLTVELYAERKLKSPSLVGVPQRVQLVGLMEESTMKGVLTFGDDGQWDISYSINIKRPQLQEERDNFRMVQKSWVALGSGDFSRLTRRASVATMHASPVKNHHKNNRNHHHHHHHKRHHHHSKKDYKEDSKGLSIHIASSTDSDSSKDHDLSEEDHISEKLDQITNLKTDTTSRCQNQNQNTRTKLKVPLFRRISNMV